MNGVDISDLGGDPFIGVKALERERGRALCNGDQVVSYFASPTFFATASAMSAWDKNLRLAPTGIAADNGSGGSTKGTDRQTDSNWSITQSK